MANQNSSRAAIDERYITGELPMGRQIYSSSIISGMSDDSIFIEDNSIDFEEGIEALGDLEDVNLGIN
jgi:hypothetical protein